MKTCLIKLEKGSAVMYEDGRKGCIKSITLVPNGINSPGLIASLVVELENGNNIQATANRFTPCEDEEYKEHYPSVHLIHIDEEPPKEAVVSSVDAVIKEQSEMYASLHESKLQDEKDWLKVRVHYYSGAMWHKETVQPIIESHAELLEAMKEIKKDFEFNQWEGYTAYTKLKSAIKKAELLTTK